MTSELRPATDLVAAARRAIRDVPDFPRPGIVFKDVTPLLGDGPLFARVTDSMAAPFADRGVTHVAAIESRGFLFGAPVAQRLGVGLIPIRKPGKLPAASHRAEYALEYGEDALEVHTDACSAGGRVLVVDDVLATGGTAGAVARLLEALGASLVGYSFLIELDFLSGRRRLGGARVESLLRY